MARNDAEAALPHFRRAVELKPDDGVAWGNVGRALLLLHRPGPALEPLQRAVALVPGGSAHGRARAAVCEPRSEASARSGRRDAARQRELLADLVHLRQQMWTGPTPRRRVKLRDTWYFRPMQRYTVISRPARTTRSSRNVAREVRARSIRRRTGPGRRPFSFPTASRDAGCE